MKFLMVFLLVQPQQMSEPEQLVTNFYSWYVNGGYSEMKPTFKEFDNGMTDMDFSRFNEAHKRFGFSDELTERSRMIYQVCRKNLSKIPYSEFVENEDLDFHESISCDFQFWQWFGLGMEPYKYFELTETKRLNSSKYEITIGLSSRKGEQFSKSIPVTVEKKNEKWTIIEIGVTWD